MSDTKADNNNLVITHWRHNVNQTEFKKRMEISKKRLTEFEQKKEKVYIRFMKKEGKRFKKEAVKSGVNLHKNAKEENGNNEKNIKTVVKRKLFD